MSNYLIMGASRGLGQCVSELLAEGGHQVATMQRKPHPKFPSKLWDFTNKSKWQDIIKDIQAMNPDFLIYCAGGGPFGNFDSKKYSDHEWAVNLNFLFPMYLIHEIKIPMLFVGSAIAESKADANAASYAAGKHALKGLICSIKAENPSRKLKLFSPGYMQTDLLPANAWPRQQGIAKSPTEVAKLLVKWLQSDDEGFHKVVD